ncbi:peptide-methionine (S)-S-oxide reductase MsrA [Vibrio tapetis subsp. quintayensis]|uniref:peptide-methionine (S)-S-oxide reductase MsrA n=1 Tax=Vibrio tapetis TaxID=52443 RepID=UPI0025B3A141|nr:peptide-methionine (S)-S-oxide reductase MsrA [Vibrio tapetis]MDN3680372.1 peptide-methionine (S)-S-oxide reductase MsrA [Vibrio tapetis subsp. quintayensis]
MLNKNTIVSPQEALVGRETAIIPSEKHFINQSDLNAPIESEQQQILLGMGCFWGAERLFWQLDGVQSTAVGYSGGYTKNPTYDEVCSGNTAHTEVVKVVFDARVISLTQLLSHFWENHDPTQGLQQGNDRGSQYRSAIYTYNDSQFEIATASKQAYQQALTEIKRDSITTEIKSALEFYFAEDYHQQYLAKNPQGYCGLGGTGVCFPPEL